MKGSHTFAMARTRIFLFVLRGAALGLALAGSGCVSMKQPIEVGSFVETTPDGPMRGYWAKVRLNHPKVTVRVTEPLSATESAEPVGTEALLKPVGEWRQAGGATLAVNANFFAKLIPGETNDPNRGWIPGLPVDVVGLSMSAGKVVSPPRVIAGQGDPALLFLPKGSARIAYATAADLDGVVNAVAGFGPSDDRNQPGTWLVTDGFNTGATARVAPQVRHPRTAAGVSEDGHTLILVVVDGRQPGYSVGATLYDLGALMIRYGAKDAINLDGGGSTTFIYQPLDGPAVLNRPSDGRGRAVANALGVWVRK